MRETHTCCMCGKTIHARRGINPRWSSIESKGRKFYICDDHLPLGGLGAEPGQFQKSYAQVVERIDQLLALETKNE